MAQTDKYHGGLVFVGKQETVLDQFSRIVSATLEDYGHYVERQSVMNAQQARITANQYLIKLDLVAGTNSDEHTHHSEAAEISAEPCSIDRPVQRLVITLYPADPAQSDQTHTELLLVVMMYRMVEAYSAKFVEWLDPKTVLTVEEFRGAFSSVSPRRVRARQQILDSRDSRSARFTPVDKTAPNLAKQYDVISGQKPFYGYEGPVSLSEQESLSLAFRRNAHPDEIDAQESEDAPDNDVRRLASWGMTGMMVFVSAPVAASLAVVNLVKGEDFRLNTQVLSLSGMLVALESSGAVAGVMSYLPI